MDTLNLCSDGDINNYVSSLYVKSIVLQMHDLWPKVVGETKTQNPLELCSWQRWEISQANHNFECDYKSCFTLIFIQEGYHIRKYKRYTDDPSVPVPKSTKLDRNKRSATRSNTAISIPQSVVSTELKAVVLTESSASHKGEHLYKRQKQLYAIIEVRWNSGPQIVNALSEV